MLVHTNGMPCGKAPLPANLCDVQDFRLECIDYTFISVFFLTTTEPFVGAYILEDDFFYDLKQKPYDELIKEVGVHFTPMPDLYKWIESSKALGARGGFD